MNCDQPNRLTVGYTRVSSELQDRDDAYGRACQMRDIVAWAHVSGITIDKWVHDTKSGATLDRDGLSEVRELNAAGRLECLIVAKQDRLARQTIIAETLYQEIEAKGGKIVNVQIQLDGSPIGKLIRRMLDAFAELERELIRERCTKGRIEKIRKHATHHGTVPLGYALIPRDECKSRGLPSGTLEILEEKAKITKLIYQLRERGHGYPSIADWLNANGYRGAKGARFAPTTVQKVIENEEFYRGERVALSATVLGMSEDEYAKLKPAHPPILPPRPENQALLRDRMKRTPMRDATIPDDPFSNEPLVRKAKHNIHTLTRSYAEAVLLAAKYRAEGVPFKDVAVALNEAGYRTRPGYLFHQATILRMERRFDHLVPLAQQAVNRPATDEAQQPETTHWSEIAKVAHVMARNGVSRKRGAMSYATIAKRLNMKFGLTPNGGRFHSETVIRLLRDFPAPTDSIPTAGYVRMAKKGSDHLSQVDVIDAWAEKSGIEISEWYIDRGVAMVDNVLPEFKRLQSDVKEGKVARVAVFSMERICVQLERAKTFVSQLSDLAEVYTVGSENPHEKRSPYVPGRSAERGQAAA